MTKSAAPLTEPAAPQTATSIGVLLAQAGFAAGSIIIATTLRNTIRNSPSQAAGAGTVLPQTSPEGSNLGFAVGRGNCLVREDGHHPQQR